MNNFNNYKYREIDYAKLIYENGFQTKHMPTELKLLLVYARDMLNVVGKPALKDFADTFCKKCVDGYDMALWYKTINKAVTFACNKKNRLINVDSVNVTSGEIQYITNLPVSQDYKKLFFAFLVQMKLNKTVYEFKNQEEYSSIYFKGGIKKYNEIKKMSNVPSKIDINGDFIHDMNANGYIAIYYNGLIKHLWMDECKPSGDTVITVCDFDNVGYYLDYYCGEKGVRLCKKCGQPFKVSSQCKTYCKQHKQYYEPVGRKTKTCAVCGAEFVVDGRNNSKVRCTKCQTKYRLEQEKTRKSR